MKNGTLKVLERLDEIDIKLLQLLQDNGRITNADLSRSVGLSPPSVLQRVRRLEDAGYISHYATVLKPEALGFQLKVYAMVSLSLHQEQPIEGFRNEISKIGEVLECSHVSGDFDFLLKIIVRDMNHYEKLMRERLSTIPGVGKIQSSFVLGVTKCTTSLPL